MKMNRCKAKTVLIIMALLMMCCYGCGNPRAEQADVNVNETDINSLTEESGSVEEEIQTLTEETQGTASTGETEEVGTEEPETEQTPEANLEVGSAGTIIIGTTGAPYTELLTQAGILLAKDGWDVQVQTYTDYNKMNEDVVNGTLDAHLFAHQAYLDSYNDVNGTELVSVADICYEKYGIYSVLNADLTNIKNGVVIAIPKDDTQKARALLFLDELGYITLKEDVGIFAFLDDVLENPKKIEFVEYTQETLKDVLQTADYCVIGADQAILAGLEPKKEVLKEEDAHSLSAKTMAALLVTTADKTSNEKLRLLEDAIKSEEVQKYMEDTYKGAWGLFP